MKRIFADTFYWIALLNPKDDWYDSVIKVSQSIANSQIITTEEVLTEVLTFYSNSGSRQRKRTVNFIKQIMNNPAVQVIPQDHESFVAGLNLYEKRLDKGYSLTDCISMNTMNQLEIIEVLTHDQHFTQEGFIILF
jgi:predicted nucleic acid-binding protein